MPFVGSTGPAVNELFKPLVTGMGPLKPSVTVASVSRDGSSQLPSCRSAGRFPAYRNVGRTRPRPSWPKSRASGRQTGSRASCNRSWMARTD